MDISMFCDTSIIAEFIRLKGVLAGMPRYKVGIHNGKKAIHIYTGYGEELSRHVTHFGSKNYAEAQKNLELYEEYLYRMKIFDTEIKRRNLTIPDDFKYIREPSVFNVKAWESFEACANGLEVQTGYVDGYGFNVRSRGEMMVGNALKELGLEAKYEPTLILKGGRKRSPDYSFPVRIIDRCFFVEFMGMTDDGEYVDNNHVKIDEYMRNGIFINRDLIIICGTKNWIPSHESLKRRIAYFINDAVLSAYERKM
uniref:Uncharacterized protein n=1 Tax=uncultured bacterium Contig1758 TaxID=1393501 RepID=W0FIY8_9BACT|nr:hypothetical protein [uncultured bacterium Contig1758]